MGTYLSYLSNLDGTSQIYGIVDLKEGDVRTFMQSVLNIDKSINAGSDRRC